MTTPLDVVIASALRRGVSRDVIAERLRCTPEDVRIRGEAAGWVPEQPALPMGPPVRGGR